MAIHTVDRGNKRKTLVRERQNSIDTGYDSLIAGHVVSERSYNIDNEMVEQYLTAVQDTSLQNDDSFVPPMCICALSLRGAIEDLKIPGGTLHASQEITFIKPVPINQSLSCRAKISSNTIRGDWRFMAIVLSVADMSGTEVMSGKSTIMLPK